MSDETPFSEKMETGDMVHRDQTVTLRVHHAKKKIRGKLVPQCSGGCGLYLTEDEKLVHKCLGPPRPKQITKKWNKKALRKAMKEAQKAGKLAEFIAKL